MNGKPKMMRFINELWTDESGQDATEYVLLVVLIALAITAGMTVLRRFAEPSNRTSPNPNVIGAEEPRRSSGLRCTPSS